MDEEIASPCSTCGKCCRGYVVPLCGRDVWRISTSQRLSPEHFVFAREQQSEVADAFHLDQDRAYHLALDKRGPLRLHSPCVFLLELGGGYSRCGIYAERPLVCRTYPMQLRNGVTELRSQVLCPPGAWSSAALAHPSWTVGLQQQRMHQDIYHLVVARWNLQLAARGAAATANLGEYLSYLLNVYERLDRLEQAVGAAELAEVARCWRFGAGPSGNAQDDATWSRYAASVREVVDTFYPHLAHAKRL
jgi:Fe-S-cluster containining protein